MCYRLCREGNGGYTLLLPNHLFSGLILSAGTLRPCGAKVPFFDWILFERNHRRLTQWISTSPWWGLAGAIRSANELLLTAAGHAKPIHRPCRPCRCLFALRPASSVPAAFHYGLHAFSLSFRCLPVIARLVRAAPMAGTACNHAVPDRNRVTYSLVRYVLRNGVRYAVVTGAVTFCVTLPVISLPFGAGLRPGCR